MLSFLSLGDSYTIGEQVLLTESFPYRAVQLLRKTGMQITAPEIIAKTGWTTDELSNAINETVFSKRYDIVTLLIGVNNQYRGRPVGEYQAGFEELIKKAIGFAAGRSENVFVFSIPDWGVTPFAEGRDRDRIAKEIDNYNAACKMITEKYTCTFIDITVSQRADSVDAEMLAADGLHPSAKEYAKWAARFAARVISLHSAGNG